MKSDAAFKRIVLGHWRLRGRHDLPWRPPSLKLRKDGSLDPYAVLVSEIMLQQTQVGRVVPFYRAFMRRFPTFGALSGAPVSGVLSSWQGLGYNRRALMLKRCAQSVIAEHGGHLPHSFDGLRALPGIGPYTAGAILAFAFDRPHPLIETNIRRAYLHHFFPRRKDVPDSDILAVVIRHLSSGISPRTWFSALMDYGSWLALSLPKDSNPNRRSRAYVRQSPFGGSDRQLRGGIVRTLLSGKPMTIRSISADFDVSESRAARIVSGLKKDGLVEFRGARVTLNP